MKKWLTFLEKICCNENPAVDTKALMRPTMSKLISVKVAMATPPIIGIKLKYTLKVCFSPIITRDKITVKSGIVAFTKNYNI